MRKQKFAETEVREELDSMIRGVANVWMPVEDIERAVNFYQNVLGLRLVNRDGPWAEVDANGVRVGLNGREPKGAGTERGPVLSVYSVTSVIRSVFSR